MSRQQTEREPIYLYDGGEENDKGKPGKPEIDEILKRFEGKENVAEEVAASYLNSETRLNAALAELNKVRQGDATRNLVLGEREETIEELRKQLAIRQEPTPPQPIETRYNPAVVERYCVLHGIYDDEGKVDLDRGIAALDFDRSVNTYDREMERGQNEKVLNTKQINKQWDKLVRGLGEEFVAERGPEIRAAFKEYPELVARAHRDEKALTQIVRIANAEYDENKAALEEEDEELEREKLRGQVGTSGKLPAEREKEREKYKGMSAEEIADEIGFANPTDDSHFV